MRALNVSILIAATVLAGCASGSKDISTSYVSPMAYKSYTCEQLVAENDRVTRRVTELASSVDSRADGDKVAMGVGMVLFWPALFFVRGNGPEAAEYGRLKGEHEAIEKSAIEKSCALPAPPPAPVQAKAENVTAAADQAN